MEVEKKRAGRSPQQRAARMELQFKARSMKAAGATHKEVGEKLGIHRQHVTRLVTTHKKLSPGACTKCGRDCECLQKHHEDYINDIVIAVCPACHRGIHKDEVIPSRVQAKAARAEESRMAGIELRQKRMDLGVGLRDLARRLSLSHTYLTLLEHGKRKWTPALIHRYLNEIGVPQPGYPQPVANAYDIASNALTL